MLSKINTICLLGLNGYLVEVQTDITNGIPNFDIVGLPDTSVRESKERIKSAIKNSKVEFPNRRILINLSPANIKKEGTGFDLSIAIGILIATDVIRNTRMLENTIFLGELSLDGTINEISGILPICIEARKFGIKRVILPIKNAKEAAIVKDLEIIGVDSLQQMIKYFNNEIKIEKTEIVIEELLKKNEKYELDFSDVKGQENVKRALEIAAAGGHNCLLIGSPGSGKTMLAKRLLSILPDLTFEEALEITKIHSIAGTLKEEGLITKRPYRSPHHTISTTSMTGGGRIPKPGEISLSHCGILFLDEFTEFTKKTLEVLRGPLEDGEVTISRVNSTLTYPCNFQLIASMNPCMCGYYGSEEKECTCTPYSINRYLGKISGPLLDRIDIHIEVKNVKYEKLNSDAKCETSEEIRSRVNNARKIQIDRYRELNIVSNAELTPKLIDKYCKLDENGKQILEKAFKKLGLTARAYGRILKVARTIADLDNSENILNKHLAEAIQYRSLDRKYQEKL